MYKKRIAYKNLEKQNLILKILNNQNIIKIKNKKYRNNKRSSITLIRNECIFTGRKRGLIKDYKMSRLVFKRFAKSNKIPGLIKSC
jgi:small subunit ribosomal protein S14